MSRESCENIAAGYSAENTKYNWPYEEKKGVILSKFPLRKKKSKTTPLLRFATVKEFIIPEAGLKK